jgi:hypothetical protein
MMNLPTSNEPGVSYLAILTVLHPNPDLGRTIVYLVHKKGE